MYKIPKRVSVTGILQSIAENYLKLSKISSQQLKQQTFISYQLKRRSMEFLRKNAVKFLEKAEESLGKGEYNFVMFFVEQFFQLSLKYLIAKKYGDFPKTHSLKVLFELTEDEKLLRFYKDNIDTFRDIELAYVASRYFDVEYSEKAAENGLKLAKRFAEVTEIA